MIQALLSVIISAVVAAGTLFGIEQQRPPVSPAVQHAMQEYVDKAMTAKEPIFGTTQPIAGQTYNLSGAGVSQTGTSITLASFTLPQTGYKIPDSALSDTFYITLEPGNPTKQEIVSCTTDTQNANGSATFTGCIRGLSPIPDYTSSSSLKFSHGGGTQVIFSNPPQFYNEFAQLQNTESITGTWTFATSPLLTTDCTGASSNSAICAKAYIDGVAVAGASNANETTKGIGEIATGREAASSTSLGGTGARLFLPASLASSSPYSLATSTIVMTQIDGRISPSFMSTSSTYTLGGLITNASSTLLGTTTIKASSLTNNALVLNGLPYVFPSIRGASSSVLSEDGSGNLTFSTPQVSVLYNNSPNVATSATNATTTLALVKIPANTMNTGKSLRVTGMWRTDAPAGNCFPGLEFGNGSATTTVGYIKSGNKWVTNGIFNLYATSTASATMWGNMSAGTALVDGGDLQSAPISIGRFLPYSLTSSVYIAFAARSNDGGNTCTFLGGTVELISN